MSSSNHHQLTSSSSSFKSSSVSISVGDHTPTVTVITHNNPPSPPQFTNLIETEKSLTQHDEREITCSTLTPTYPQNINKDEVVITNSLTDDEDFECDSEINRITNYRSKNQQVLRTCSPEPSGNELAGLRDEPHDGDQLEFEEFSVEQPNYNVCGLKFINQREILTKSHV